MYCSAIFYPVDQLSGPIRQVVEWNPLYLYIRCLRGAVMDGLPPSLWDFLLMAAWGVGVYFIGWGIFRSLREKLLQRL